MGVLCAGAVALYTVMGLLLPCMFAIEHKSSHKIVFKCMKSVKSRIDSKTMVQHLHGHFFHSSKWNGNKQWTVDNEAICSIIASELRMFILGSQYFRAHCIYLPIHTHRSKNSTGTRSRSKCNSIIQCRLARSSNKSCLFKGDTNVAIYMETENRIAENKSLWTNIQQHFDWTLVLST